MIAGTSRDGSVDEEVHDRHGVAKRLPCHQNTVKTRRSKKVNATFELQDSSGDHISMKKGFDPEKVGDPLNPQTS